MNPDTLLIAAFVLTGLLTVLTGVRRERRAYAAGYAHRQRQEAAIQAEACQLARNGHSAEGILIYIGDRQQDTDQYHPAPTLQKPERALNAA